MNSYWMGFVIAALLCLSSASAKARGFRVDQLPDAPNSCNTCHVNGGGTPRNDFGQTVEQTLRAPLNTAAVDWPAVCPLDSDGDGASNGAELGDPTCSWRIGDPSREATGDPADSAVLPAMPDGGIPDGSTGPDSGGPTDAGTGPDPVDDPDDGGCSTTGKNGASPSLLVLVLGLLLWGLRRPRGAFGNARVTP